MRSPDLPSAGASSSAPGPFRLTTRVQRASNPGVRIALSQIDTTVGAFAGNGERIVAQARAAAEQGAELVVFPELTLCGYPPKDLLELREFVDRCQAALAQLAKDPVFGRVPALVGF